MLRNSVVGEQLINQINTLIINSGLRPRDKVDSAMQDLFPVSTEVFFIYTEKVNYLAVIYPDEGQQPQSVGYIIFPDKSTWYFTLDGGKVSGVREKCLSVSQQVARLYGGALQHWDMGGDGGYSSNISPDFS
jgi:hypothetical protein